jgi:signal transduction histidine kinase
VAERVRTSRAAQVVATVAVALGVLAAVLTVTGSQHTAELESEVRTREAAANAVPAVAASLRTTLTDIGTRGGTSRQLVAFDDAESAGIPVDVAVQARDTGKAVLDQRGLVVAPRYSTDAPPGSVAERRRAVTGLYAVPIRLGPTLQRLRPSGGGVAVQGPSRTVAQVGGSAPDGSSSYSVPLSTALAPGWSVQVWTPGTAVPTSAWGVAALCLLVASVGALLIVRRGRAAALADRELARLRRRTEVLADLAAVSQRSLDLADVLPATTTALSDALGLRGLTLTTPTPEGERAFFRHGEAPRPAVGSVLPPHVAAGESASLLLARGSRTVARLNVLAGRDLDAEDLSTLEAAGEILSSSLTNAEAFAQQREVLQRLRAVDELKTVFLATASHELRTPVGVISGFAELLKTYVDDLDPERIRGYATRIDATAQQLATLVDNLLDFSRMERGMHGTEGHVDLDLGSTVRRILDDHQDLSAHHAIVPSTARGLVVHGTTHAVERVLTNLVGNAAKYSPAGTTIRVVVREEDGRAVLHVDDEGAGVAPADRDQVFSRFYRGKGDAVTGTRGAGLGLAIVHEFAASMGGTASVSESPSGGARFTVRFPLVEGADPSLVLTPAASEGASDVLT